jgi:hypothetical protein
MSEHYRFDHDYELEKFYSPEPIDNSRYEQAQDEYESSRENLGVRIVSTGKMLSEDEREMLFER